MKQFFQKYKEKILATPNKKANKRANCFVAFVTGVGMFFSVVSIFNGHVLLGALLTILQIAMFVDSVVAVSILDKCLKVEGRKE